MSKASKQEPDDDLLLEYDFPSMSGGIRGKYYRRYRAGAISRFWSQKSPKPSLGTRRSTRLFARF